jgi:hypothetical protein
MTTVIWMVVAGWVIATIAANLPRVGRRIQAVDLLGIVPSWTFFAPNPGVSDSVVLVRDLLDDGGWTSWSVAWLEPCRPYTMWWRPTKRISKLVTDCASTIPRSALEGDETLGADYLLLASLARDASHDWRSVGFQFAIADVASWWRGGRTPVLLYRSPMMSLRPAAGVQ